MNRLGRRSIPRQKISNKQRRGARLGDKVRSTMDYFFIGTSLLKIIGMIFIVILPMVSYAVYAERRVSAFMQDRLGPNRVGPAGLLLTISDAPKVLLKEDFTPAPLKTFYYM